MCFDVAAVSGSGAPGESIRKGGHSSWLLDDRLQAFLGFESIKDESERGLVVRTKGLWIVDDQLLLLKTETHF